MPTHQIQPQYYPTADLILLIFTYLLIEKKKSICSDSIYLYNN
jgi:hypothetical protein